MLWITDSLSAAHAIVKGSAQGLECYDLLVDIFDEAERKKINVMALWVPRELNTFADMLSHLCFYSVRQELHARASDFA